MGNDQLLARNLEATKWAALKKHLFLHSNPAFRTPWVARGTAREIPASLRERQKESKEATAIIGGEVPEAEDRRNRVRGPAASRRGPSRASPGSHPGLRAPNDPKAAAAIYIYI